MATTTADHNSNSQLNDELITVVMPVYNACPYIDDAIISILQQTYTHFRFVIYDDASTDESLARARHFAEQDSRICIMTGRTRLGPVGSSNAAAKAATTELVARMDADDIAHPERLALQVRALKQNPQAVLVGSNVVMVDKLGKELLKTNFSRPHSKIPIIPHPTFMYRRQAFDDVGGYTEGTEYFEDNYLLKQLAAKGSLLFINECLLQYRLAGQNSRARDTPKVVEDALTAWYALAFNKSMHGKKPTQRTIPPYVFLRLLGLKVAIGQSPRLFSRALARMQFNPKIPATTVMLLILLSELFPKLVLFLVKLSYWAKTVRSQSLCRKGHLYEWCNDGAAMDIGLP